MNKLQTIFLSKKDASLFVCGVVQGECSHVTDVEQIQGYVFTPEELKQLLSDAFDAGNKSGLAGYSNISYHTQYDKQQYIENILNKEK